jgi:preprotein translocase subunit SecF
MTTMSKTCKKVDKLTLTSVIIAIVVAVAIVITAIFGVNYSATSRDSETVTVTVSSYLYDTESNRNAVENVCTTEFEKYGLEVKYTQYGEMSGTEDEIVYVFEKGVAVDKAVEAINAKFDARTSKEGDAWYGFEIVARVATESVPVKIAPVNYILTAVAIAVFAVVAFIYVSLRYRVFLGGLTAIAIAVSALATTAVILVTRFPFTYSLLACIATSAFLTAVFVLLSINKLRAVIKGDEDKKFEDRTPVAEAVESSVAWKEILVLAAATAIALVLVGAIATTSTLWFALGALIALIVATAISLFFVPSLCVPMMARANARAIEKSSSYKGAKAVEKEETAEVVAPTETVEE